MVEARRVELLSENTSKGTSPGADACCGDLLPCSLSYRPNVKPIVRVASLCMVRSKLCALTFASHRRLPPGRGPPGGDGSRLKPRPEQLYRCSLIYNCPFYGCQAHPPAIPISASPSKPLRPLVVANFTSLALTASGRARSFRCSSSSERNHFVGFRSEIRGILPLARRFTRGTMFPLYIPSCLRRGIR